LRSACQQCAACMGVKRTDKFRIQRSQRWSANNIWSWESQLRRNDRLWLDVVNDVQTLAIMYSVCRGNLQLQRFNAVNRSSDLLMKVIFVIVQLKGGSTVVKVLCYKSESRRFDPKWCHWNFFIDIKFFRSHYGPGVDSASNRNEYQEHFPGGKGGRCVRLTTLLPSCAVVMKSGNLNFLKPS